MIVPEKEKGIRSFKIPGIFVRSLAFVLVLISILFGIFIYNYWTIIQQIHENKHLGLENRQLRKQIQLFQMKMNTLADDLQRINTFENKLRIITGLEDVTKSAPIKPNSETDSEMMHGHEHGSSTINNAPKDTSVKLDDNLLDNLKGFETLPAYVELQGLYDTKIANHFGISKKYKITRKFSNLIKKSFELSREYSSFDYKYSIIKKYTNRLEQKIHSLDQYLLDKESILRSTPTILPTNGWITSYFGRRISPTAGVMKMHEGLDLGATYGTEIVAPADGVVTFAGRKAGFGLFVQIDHGYGIETIYAHSQKILTKTGRKVKRGDLLAKVGSTGSSTGPHLHYEVRVNGTAVDPLYFVLN